MWYSRFVTTTVSMPFPCRNRTSFPHSFTTLATGRRSPMGTSTLSHPKMTPLRLAIGTGLLRLPLLRFPSERLDQAFHVALSIRAARQFAHGLALQLVKGVALGPLLAEKVLYKGVKLPLPARGEDVEQAVVMRPEV